MTQKIVTHRTFKAHLRKDGIIEVIHFKGVDMSLQDAIEGVDIIKEHYLVDGKKRPLFTDYTLIKSQSRECRVFFASDGNAKNFSSVAILTGSSFGNIIANFYMGFNKPVIPTRLFSSKEKAIAWLKEVSPVLTEV
ncbi:MAG: hypothetical protein ACI9S8_002857 [Chlamydiales bacterium]|jgi:hypothetical protein